MAQSLGDPVSGGCSPPPTGNTPAWNRTGTKARCQRPNPLIKPHLRFHLFRKASFESKRGDAFHK